MILGWLYFFNNQWVLLDEPGLEYLEDTFHNSFPLRPLYSPIEDEE